MANDSSKGLDLRGRKRRIWGVRIFSCLLIFFVAHFFHSGKYVNVWNTPSLPSPPVQKELNPSHWARALETLGHRRFQALQIHLVPFDAPPLWYWFVIPQLPCSRDAHRGCAMYTSLAESDHFGIEQTLYSNLLTDFPCEKSGGFAHMVQAGANIGIFTLLGAAMGCHATAFDPDMLNVPFMGLSRAMNNFEDKFSIVRAAVGERSGGSVSFFSSHNRVQSAFGGKPGDDGLDTHSFEVPLIALDTAFPHQKLRLLIVDVEGNENNVLHGAKELIRSHRISFLRIEQWVFMDNDLTIRSTSGLQLLVDAGFKLYSNEVEMSISTIISNAENIRNGRPAQLCWRTDSNSTLCDIWAVSPDNVHKFIPSRMTRIPTV